MTAGELIERLQYLLASGANGLNQNVLTPESEVQLWANGYWWYIDHVSFDCLEPGEPWVICIEAGSEVE